MTNRVSLRRIRDVIVLGFVALSMLQSLAATRLLLGRYPWQPASAGLNELWCGNALTDPLAFLLNGAVPFTYLVLVGFSGRPDRDRRWTAWDGIVTTLFLVTVAGLVTEVCVVKPYGLDVLRQVWWLPWRWRHYWPI